MSRSLRWLVALLSLVAVSPLGACRDDSSRPTSIAPCGIKVPIAQKYLIGGEFDEDGYHTVEVTSTSAGRPSSATDVFGEFDSKSFEVSLDARSVGPGVTSLGSIKRLSTGCEVIFTLYEAPSVEDIVKGAAWVLTVSWPNDV